MAVKTKEKLPTPSEVSGEPTKFTQEEINQITELQNKTQSVVFQLGQLKLSEMQLESKLQELKQILTSIETEETTLAEGFSNKYGIGSLNIETGEFTPNK
jgi:cell shape-determining protein MreC